MRTTIAYKEASVFFETTYTNKCVAKKNRINYTTFGAPLPGRMYNSSKYRFGYNKGSEKDDEIYGEGNSYTTYFREIDVRIVRLWGTDPSVKAWESPFVLNHNSPLLFVDPFGDDPPKRLSLWSRVDNVMKGDSYKNKANKYAVENKVDEARISTGNGKVKIDESYYKNYQSGSEKGLLTGGTTLIEKSVVFNDSDPEEGNKYDWAGNCPFKIGGLGMDVTGQGNADLLLLSGNAQVTNSSRLYGRSESGRDVTNYTSVSIEGKNQASRMGKFGLENSPLEIYGYFFITNKSSMSDPIGTPKLYNKQTLQLIFLKIQYKATMNKSGDDFNWELKVGATSNERPFDYTNSTGIEKRFTNKTTE